MFKKFITIFLFLFLIIFCLFIASSSVSADTIDDYSSSIDNALNNISEIQDGANWCIVQCSDNYYYVLTCGSYNLGNNSFANFVQNNQNYIFCCDSSYRLSRRASTKYYRLSTNGTYTFYDADSSEHRLNLTMPNVYFSSTDIHYENSSTVFFASTGEPSFFTTPSFANYDDSNWGNTLITGAFNFFYIDAGDSPYIHLFIYDTTYGLANDFDNRNWSAILDENSPYRLIDNYGQVYYAIDKTTPFGAYLNEHDYELAIDYKLANGSWANDHPFYQWSTDFSQETISNANQELIGSISQRMEDIRNFFNNDSINNSDFELPEVNVNDFTFSFFSTILTSIYDCFLDVKAEETLDVEFLGSTYTLNSKDFNVLKTVNLSYLKGILSLMWCFAIGLFIYKDARKRIYYLKEFHWSVMFADDITIDSL